jgi:putative acetyltransferase
MQDDFTIRHAVPDDAAGIAECYYLAVHEKAQGFYSDAIIADWAKPVTPERIEKFRQSILGEEEEVYVAVADDIVIGMTIIRLSDAKMGCLYVRPNKYGQIGSALMDKAVACMQNAGKDHMVLDATLAAEGFYRRHGFRETGRGIQPKRNMEYIIMRRDF